MADRGGGFDSSFPPPNIRSVHYGMVCYSCGHYYYCCVFGGRPHAGRVVNLFRVVAGLVKSDKELR